ncbi:uroporphyrinogen-III synthase [Xanthobacter agilis]|uniref:Uroporphyrinogen-III synthase n=1 Tax=Xanthobacter agilis TaxID=47492 RepID=A0ABU0LIL1_XANAG|nr:uroporphyrinogen-III synthase [Xanthobacter agilis]MDQ0506980.1 uroporphyrinogen-III synthase [Xanthobacter agilis]
MHFLITRPEPAATQTAERLRKLGHAVTVDPMLRIAATTAPLPTGPFDAVAFTSINGVTAFAAHPQGRELFHLPAFAVGTRTAKAARAAGFTHVTDCAGDADALAGRLAEALPKGARVLNPAGEDRAADLAELLKAPGLDLVLTIIYAAEPADALSEEARAALAAGHINAALHFSQRTVKTLLACVTAAGLTRQLAGVREFCLSEQVGGPLVKAGYPIEAASAPNEDALFALF